MFRGLGFAAIKLRGLELDSDGVAEDAEGHPDRARPADLRKLLARALPVYRVCLIRPYHGTWHALEHAVVVITMSPCR